MSTRYYAGIGSRSTPPAMLAVMKRVAERLDARGFTLRSGGAQGADQAFASGSTRSAIYIPWPGFAEGGYVAPVSDEAVAIASAAHPAWDRCSMAARKLHVRNVYQVLGTDLRTPSEFIVCWTEGGSGSGGTGQAIRIAKARGIPVFDLGFGCRKVLAALALYLDLLDVAK